MILPLLMLIMFCITNLESIDPLSHLLLAFGSYYIVTGVGEKDMVTLSQTQSEKEKVKQSKEREKRRRRRRRWGRWYTHFLLFHWLSVCTVN